MERKRDDYAILDWLRLVRTPNVGSVTFHKLVTHYGSPTSAINASEAWAGRKAGKIPSRENALQELDATEALGGRILCLDDADYPAQLAQTELPPPIISVIGNIGLFRKPTVAIVGARNASVVGLKMAETMARDLGKSGIVVASGLARGIDGAAHQASLETGTIAVLAGGVDQAYPPQHTKLYHQIAEHGLLVSERPLGFVAGARDFPRRNRIVAALCKGLVVIEAAERSGSLISARLAGELGREIMAVPGSPMDARSGGTNHLIREGAVLVRDAEDVLSVLDEVGQTQSSLFAREDGASMAFEPMQIGDFCDPYEDGNDYQNIIAHLSIHPIALTQLADVTGLTINHLASLITELEIDGKVTSHAGGGVSLALD